MQPSPPALAVEPAAPPEPTASPPVAWLVLPDAALVLLLLLALPPPPSTTTLPEQPSPPTAAPATTMARKRWSEFMTARDASGRPTTASTMTKRIPRRGFADGTRKRQCVREPW